MWNRWNILQLLAIAGCGLICPNCPAQEWLGHTREEIRQQLGGKAGVATFPRETPEELEAACTEEDERCRKFDVEYLFRFEQDTCTTYIRRLPLHAYWAVTLREEAEQQEAQSSGEELEIDGEPLRSEYRTESYTMRLRVEETYLIATFALPNTY